MNCEILEAKRKSKKLTVTELCDMANVDCSTYYRMLEDPQKGRFSTVSKLVAALKLNAVERSKLFD